MSCGASTTPPGSSCAGSSSVPASSIGSPSGIPGCCGRPPAAQRSHGWPAAPRWSRWCLTSHWAGPRDAAPRPAEPLPSAPAQPAGIGDHLRRGDRCGALLRDQAIAGIHLPVMTANEGLLSLLVCPDCRVGLQFEPGSHQDGWLRCTHCSGATPVVCGMVLFTETRFDASDAASLVA